MRTIRRVGVGLCLACAFPLIASAQDVEAEIRTAYEAWNEAFNKGDAKALAELYADDAVVLPPTHEVVQGPGEIETFFSSIIGSGVSDHELEIIEAGGEETLYGAANWSASGKSGDGQATDIGGIATYVFERQEDGSLKLVLHTFN